MMRTWIMNGIDPTTRNRHIYITSQGGGGGRNLPPRESFSCELLGIRKKHPFSWVYSVRLVSFQRRQDGVLGAEAVANWVYLKELAEC